MEKEISMFDAEVDFLSGIAKYAKLQGQTIVVLLSSDKDNEKIFSCIGGNTKMMTQMLMSLMAKSGSFRLAAATALGQIQSDLENIGDE